jgi:hypothetical protein
MNCLGKTVFLFYLLFIRILQKKVTLLRLSDNQFIGFSNDGVRLHSLHLPQMDANWDYPLGTWALVDSYCADSLEMNGPLFDNNKLFVILTTSPKVSRYHGWAERTHSPLYVMDPTYEEELQAYR